MTEFFRVENDLRQGPYINGCELRLMQWLDKEGVVDRDGWDHDEYMRSHPSPMGRDQELFEFYYGKKNRSEYVFGFESIDQLREWFSLPKELEYLSRYGFYVGVYALERPDFLVTEHQMVVNKNDLRMVERLSVDDVFKGARR